MLPQGGPKVDARTSLFLLKLTPRFLNLETQHCAQTLLEFNGGASCVQVYVNQHDFFINNVRETPVPVDVTL